MLEGGIQGIFVSGSQGEFWAISKEEKQRLFEITVEQVDGRVAVYAGTGAESTREVIELTKIAEDIGVDAASIITPYFVRSNDHELRNHYKTVAEKVDLPILLYGNPSRTGVRISPVVFSTLVEEYSNIVGIKDSSGDLSITLDYINACGDKASTVLLK